MTTATTPEGTGRAGNPARRTVVLLSPVRAALRALYGDSCQACGRVLTLVPGESYAEVHALVPPGAEEVEEPERGACLVVCPEHHALFDLGVMAVDPQQRTLWCADPQDRLAGRPLSAVRHELSAEALVAAWTARRVSEATAAPTGLGHRTVESLLHALFSAALHPDETRGFEQYLALMQGGTELPPTVVANHRRFGWAQLRRRAGSYVREGDPGRYTVAYMRPPEVTAETTTVRISLASGERSPAPVSLVRGEDGVWWLDFNGL